MGTDARRARIARKLTLTPRFEEIAKNYTDLKQMNLRFYLSPSLKLGYVKNHKAGSTSIVANLSHISQLQLDGVARENYQAVHGQRPKGFYAARGLGYSASDKLFDDEEAFIFTAVREPLKRTISAFADKFMKRKNERRDINQALGFDADKIWNVNEFFEQLIEDEGFRDSNVHWRSQRKEISYDQIPYDCIAPLHEISLLQDMVFVHVLGKTIPRVDARKDMGHRTNSAPYLDALSEATREKFREIYAADYEMLQEVKAKWKDDSKAFHVLLGDR